MGFHFRSRHAGKSEASSSEASHHFLLGATINGILFVMEFTILSKEVQTSLGDWSNGSLSVEVYQRHEPITLLAKSK